MKNMIAEKILKKLYDIKIQKLYDIDHRIFFDDDLQASVLHVEGSNDWKDWLVNIAGLFVQPFGHLGYRLKQANLKKLIAHYKGQGLKKFYLSCHSHGAGIVCRYMTQEHDDVIHAFAFEPPAGIGFLEPVKVRHTSIYLVSNSFIAGSWLYFLCRFGTRPIRLKKEGDNMIDAHMRNSIIDALEKMNNH